MFASIDTDADGKISKDEAAKAERPMLSKRFDEIDTNKDTYLDKDELKAFREKQRANRKQKQE
jgi:Ca2+-binding EF-hand superfamily protein